MVRPCSEVTLPLGRWPTGPHSLPSREIEQSLLRRPATREENRRRPRNKARTARTKAGHVGRRLDADGGWTRRTGAGRARKGRLSTSACGHRALHRSSLPPVLCQLLFPPAPVIRYSTTSSSDTAAPTTRGGEAERSLLESEWAGNGK